MAENPGVGFVVHSAEYQTHHTLDIDGRVALTIAPEVPRDIGFGKGPRKSLAAFGYAGQLDDELAHGVWITVPEDPALMFDDDRAKLWDDARASEDQTMRLAQCEAVLIASPFPHSLVHP